MARKLKKKTPAIVEAGDLRYFLVLKVLKGGKKAIVRPMMELK